MVQLSASSALVGGAIPSATVSEQITVRAIRGFLYLGSAVAIGATVSLPANIARELIAMAKAEKCAPADPGTAEDYTPRRRGRPPKTEE